MSSFLGFPVPARGLGSNASWPERTFCTGEFAARLIVFSIAIAIVCAWMRMRMLSLDVELEPHRMHSPVRPGTRRFFPLHHFSIKTNFADENTSQQNISMTKSNSRIPLPSMKLSSSRWNLQHRSEVSRPPLRDPKHYINPATLLRSVVTSFSLMRK
jgi:hypothetical protein